MSKSTSNGPSAQASPSLLEIALAHREAGRSVLPIAKGKIPSIMNPATGEIIEIAWKIFQRRLATPEEIRRWFDVAHSMGFAIACGPVSGITLKDGARAALEIMDFDSLEMLQAFEDLLKARGLIKLFMRLIQERTPRPGGHLAYACVKIAGNTKLASEKVGILPNGKDEVKTLIETRGLGGQAVVAPTPAGIHPDCPERGYELIAGNWEHLPVITPEERQALWECARALNRYVSRDAGRNRRQGQTSSEIDRVGDDYNHRISPEDNLALLIKHGWEAVHRGGDVYDLRRPGKTGLGYSATLGYVGSNILYVFTTNGSPFENDRSYDPFGVVVRLEYAGDFKRAAKALAAEGYGRQHDRNDASGCDGGEEHA